VTTTSTATALSERVSALAQVDTTDAAKIIGMSESWLEHDRQKPVPEIPFVRMGARAVRYRLTVLGEYLDRQQVGRPIAA
jgi:hypothetical protein